jgi:hypothetical protein
MSADNEILTAYRKAMIKESIHFLNQNAWVNDHPVPNKASLIGVEYAGGNEMKNKLLVIDNQGVAGIVAALKTYYTVSLFSQQVNDFAFSFVSPLGSNDNDICHGILFPDAIAAEQGRAWK